MTTGPYGRWLPWDASAHGAEIDRLLSILHYFMVLLFVAWGVFFVYCLVRFRARAGHAAQYRLPSGKASKYAEIGVAIFEAVLLIGFSMPVWARYKEERPPPEGRVEVRAVGEQFAWNFQYPGKDGKFSAGDPRRISPSNPLGLEEGTDDIVSATLHVPVGRDMYVRISSKDVIHSFAVPVMRVKQDAVPGVEVPVWFRSTKVNSEFRAAMTRSWTISDAAFEKKMAGLVAMQDYLDAEGGAILKAGATFSAAAVERLKKAGITVVSAAPKAPAEVICAQLCGANHFQMKAPMSLDTQEEFEAWLANPEGLPSEVKFDEEFEG